MTTGTDIYFTEFTYTIDQQLKCRSTETGSKEGTRKKLENQTTSNRTEGKSEAGTEDGRENSMAAKRKTGQWKKGLG
jgi:hypothetical protein